MQNATTPPKSLHGNDTMNNFYPALVQCFGIILCGYIAGRFKIISNAETKGMSTFVGTFALPSLIFLNLLELNWSTVNWSFLLAILVAKGVVFFVVLIVSLLVSRPLNYARAGLMAIFCTQSNDFAIGHPIVMALYKDIHPEYPSYLYLMAPISLAILNPIGLALMEIAKIVKNKEERTRNPPLGPETTPEEQMSKWNRFFGERSILVFNIIVALFFNPLLLMTLLGVAGGFLFPHAIPECICSILRTLGKSFSATALFLLGMKIVGGAGSEKKSNGFLLPGVLILMKIVVLPLVIRQTVNLMESGHNANETTELSSFGFLYGAIPTAAVAFVVATRYNLEVESVARSLVFCTIISAPVMFISAKMISVKNLKVEDYLYELDAFSFDISVAGAAACCCMLVLLIVTKRFKRMPQRITFCLVLSQLMCCIGVILWSKMEHVHQWPLYFQFFLFNIGTYSTRLWTGLLAISLLFLQCRSLGFGRKIWPYMMVFAWGVPAIISVFLVIFDSNVMSGTKYNPSFQYGNVQAFISVLMLVICFIVTVVCLVIHQRYKKRFENYMPQSRPLANTESESEVHSIISTTNLMGRTDHSSIRTTSYSSSNDDEMIPTATGMVTTRASASGSRASETESDSGCGDRVDNPSTASTAVVDIEDQKNRERQSTNAKNSKDLDTMETASTNDDGPSISSHQIEHFEDQDRSGLEPLEQTTDSDEHQTIKHTVLLIILLGSIFVELAVFVWTLVMEKMSGIYWELSFLDVFLNFGQGLIVLAVFITDVGELLMPVVRFWRKLWYGTDGVSLPHWSNLKPETLHICDQFRNHHLENCKKDIAKDRRWRFQAYCQVFYGSEFVSWLIEVGLSKDRLEAVHYGRHLVDGRVLRHINNVYHFEDKLLLYNFCSRN